MTATRPKDESVTLCTAYKTLNAERRTQNEERRKGWPRFLILHSAFCVLHSFILLLFNLFRFHAFIAQKVVPQVLLPRHFFKALHAVVFLRLLLEPAGRRFVHRTRYVTRGNSSLLWSQE